MELDAPRSVVSVRPVPVISALEFAHSTAPCVYRAMQANSAENVSESKRTSFFKSDNMRRCFRSTIGCFTNKDDRTHSDFLPYLRVHDYDYRRFKYFTLT